MPGGDSRIGAALAEHGVLVLGASAADVESVERVAAVARRAFALPEAVKARYRGPLDGSQRGYLPLRTALPNGREALDRKEAWHARPSRHRAANLFPEEVPRFAADVLALVDRLEVVAGRVLDGVGSFLGLPPGSLRERCREGDSLFRLNHYPERAPGEPTRFLAHQDFDLVTLLLGASGPGLETQGRDGVWRAVEAGAGHIVVIAGDLLAAESGGRIAATPHRVVAPQACDGGRLSMTYFVSPRPDVVLANGVVAGALVDERLREAGYA